MVPFPERKSFETRDCAQRNAWKSPPESGRLWRWSFGGILLKQLSAYRPHYRRGSSAAEWDGLEDLPRVRRIGNASRPALRLFCSADAFRTFYSSGLTRLYIARSFRRPSSPCGPTGDFLPLFCCQLIATGLSAFPSQCHRIYILVFFLGHL